MHNSTTKRFTNMTGADARDNKRTSINVFAHSAALSYRVTSCTLYTCDHGISNTSLYYSMFVCECNVNHHHCSMHIQTYSCRCPPLTRARHHSTRVRIRYAHTSCQIIVTKLPMARQCLRSGRNVSEALD